MPHDKTKKVNLWWGLLTVAYKNQCCAFTFRYKKQGWHAIAAILALTCTGWLISTMAGYQQQQQHIHTVQEKAVQEKAVQSIKPEKSNNPCADKDPNVVAVPCTLVREQSGVNVSNGYQGDRETTAIPIAKPFANVGLCPVNVHWHLGAEHYSMGEYDEHGTGPVHTVLAIRQGYQCRYYNITDSKFTTPYQWDHCQPDMVVGQTYEVHWPHSSAGACNTPWQYQTPYLDGVFCKDGLINLETTTTSSQIGIQAQIFTIVNDESYYYDHLFQGMIVDDTKGVDVACYTGSTTGSSFNNEICSPYTPITWHVDRKCHLISASSFDKMCQDMKAQADDMEADLQAHGSRELVRDNLAANTYG